MDQTPSSPDPLQDRAEAANATENTVESFQATTTLPTPSPICLSSSFTQEDFSFQPGSKRPLPYQGFQSNPKIKRTNLTTQMQPNNTKDALDLALHYLVEACHLAPVHNKRNLLDLVDVFRDYTETGRVNKHGLSILANQVNSLENASKTFLNGAKKYQQPLQSAPNKQDPKEQQLSTPTTWAKVASTNSTNSTNSIISPPTQEQWKTVNKKNPTEKKQTKTLASRQLVLTQQTQQNWNSLILRNQINNAFQTKGIKGPVVASITPSKNQNIVLTTTESFNAKFLIQHQEIWQNFVQFSEALEVQPWFKVAIHNIPTSLSTNQDLAILKDEIATFNKGLQIVGNPYWLTKEDRRQQQNEGTACIAFKSEEDANRAINKKLYLLGTSVRAEKLRNTPPSTQCSNCQKFGHISKICKRTPTCRICAQEHPTFLHYCNTCKAKGKECTHSIISCANCNEPHTADSKECETYAATIATRNATRIQNTEHLC